MHLMDSDKQEHYCMAILTFKVMNNKPEYETLVAGLSIAAEIEATELETKTDSQMVVNQVLGQYATKSEKLKNYLTRVWELRDLFSHFSITQILKSNNQVAYRLTRAASDMDEVSLPWPVIKKLSKSQ